MVEGFEQTLAAYGTDLNGDGKVVVRVNDTAYSVNSPQNYRALQQQKFNSEMMNSSTYLFITDESVYNEISEKVFIPEAFLTHAQKAFPTKGTKFETELLQNIRLPEGESFTPAPYYISIRKCDPNNTLGYKRQAEATELLKRVISGTNPQKETVQNEK
ncbi:MAG: hypothetical protein BGN88_12720 [Clostridiales bacterium 43-6]|nr:MAG: hypothetical protein BGN88_12720 [Clostridiales bacterium 43-6]